jgi:hypothetical protein
MNNDLDLSELKRIVEKAKQPYSHPFLSFSEQLVGMLLAGARHRDVAVWANTRAGLVGDRAYDNNRLSNLVAYWKKKNIVDIEKASFMAKQILAFTEKPKSQTIEVSRPAPENKTALGFNNPFVQ